jgi:Uma2 family endonuclease
VNIPDDKLPARAMILDRELIRRAYAIRTAHGNLPHDEVWDGLLVLYPLPDNEHQEIKSQLLLPLAATDNRGALRLGVNISDRREDWMTNFRCPDLVAYLPDNPATNHDTHWLGGPDFLVEIVSPGEDPRQKLDFYAKVKTREVLIVDRDPWVVELYRFKRGKMVLVGKSDATKPAVLTSTALPLTFQMQPGTPRPTILISHTATKQTWTA